MIETFLFLALSLVQQEFANLPQFDHSIEWHTLETEHFYIHYPPSMENPAKKLSQMVEPIRKRLADKFMSAPKGRVHVVLTDFIDDSNGLSSPIPYNVIYLYAAPPPDDSSLDDYDDWLKMLFTHEFTHSVHLDMAGGINSILRSIFGRIIVPNAAQQQWGLEGLAELEETLETTRGRGRSPFVEMFLRTISLENKFLPIERATYWHDLYPYGNAAYFYGIGFYQYLIRQYGEDKIYEFTRLTSRSIVPAFFNFKTNKIFGKSFSRLWSEWAEEERAKWNAFRYEHPSSSPSKSLLPFEQRVEGQPTFDDLGTTLYVPIVDQDLKSQVRAFHLDDPTKISSEKVVDGILPPRLFFHKNFLFYSRLSFFDPFRTYSDVFALDLKTKKSHRLTKGLRLHDPLVVGNQIIAVRDDALKASIVRFPLPEDLTKSDGTPLEDPKQLEVLYHANGFDTIDKPSVSPDQKLLVFSMRREMKGRNLFLLNLGTHELRQLTAEGYDDYHPLFTPDGSHILFSSARPLENGKKDSVLVSNIFSLDLGNQKIKPVTQVLTGANWPTLGKGTLAFGHFRSTGFALQTMSYKLDAKSKNTLHPFKKINPSDNVSYDLPPNAVIRPYQKANTLWPHYILPFFFYTESDSALGITTSTFDPLQTHLWSAAAYYLSSPNRPGASFNCLYNGFDKIVLSTGFSAGITDYGSVLFFRDPNNHIQNFSDHYFERNYYTFVGAAGKIVSSNGFTGFTLGDNLFAERHESLLALPTGSLSGRADLHDAQGQTIATNVVLGPEKGNRLGNLAFISYETKILQAPLSESPTTGTKMEASLEYTPQLWKSDFKTMTGILSGKSYYEMHESHYLAMNGTLGLQMLNPLYQRTFQLGGSFGESPFTSVNKRLHPLRGLPTGLLRGEGIATGSLEYRFSIFRNMPGFGTAPLWFKNLHGALFFDGGQTFEWKHSTTLIEFYTTQMQRFGWNRFSLSSGLEIQSNVSLSYAPPLNFRLGYGQMLYLQGDWIGDRRTHQVYFSAGSSF